MYINYPYFRFTMAENYSRAARILALAKARNNKAKTHRMKNEYVVNDNVDTKVPNEVTVNGMPERGGHDNVINSNSMPEVEFDSVLNVDGVPEFKCVNIPAVNKVEFGNVVDVNGMPGETADERYVGEQSVPNCDMNENDYDMLLEHTVIGNEVVVEYVHTDAGYQFETAADIFQNMCSGTSEMRDVPEIVVEMNEIPVGAEVICETLPHQTYVTAPVPLVTEHVLEYHELNAAVHVVPLDPSVQDRANTTPVMPVVPVIVPDHDYNPERDLGTGPQRKRKVAAELRLKGEKYVGYGKRDGKVTQDVTRDERALQPRCTHGEMGKITDRTYRCVCITEQARENLKVKFWSLPSWDAKRSYLRGLVDTLKPTTRRRGLESHKKQQSHHCYMPNPDGIKMRVCLQLFCATLCISQKTLRRWLYEPELHSNDASAEADLAVPLTHNSRHASKHRRQKIIEWLSELPKVPSHYCRASSNRVYVESTFRSVSHMHQVYHSWCSDNELEPASRQIFSDILENKKISIHQPRKDQCDICCGYKVCQIDTATYEAHQVKQAEAREAKRAAKEAANDNKLVITMDLQSTLLAPNLLASSVYYKMKLQVHNFTVYCLNDSDVHLYVWHEGNGGVSSNEFVSCIVDFINTKTAGSQFKEIVLISDGCCYQNRNKVLASALASLSEITGLTIEQLILEKGHTMMEADSVHSSLQRHFKPPIYAPSDYLAQMRLCRPHHPYKVKYVDYTFFKRYESVVNIKSIRPGIKAGDNVVTDIRGLLYKPTGEIFYKLRHTDEFTVLPERQCAKKDRKWNPDNFFRQPPKLKKDKYTHLQQMKALIPVEYHPFYDTLTHD